MTVATTVEATVMRCERCQTTFRDESAYRAHVIAPRACFEGLSHSRRAFPRLTVPPATGVGALVAGAVIGSGLTALLGGAGSSDTETAPVAPQPHPVTLSERPVSVALHRVPVVRHARLDGVRVTFRAPASVRLIKSDGRLVLEGPHGTVVVSAAEVGGRSPAALERLAGARLRRDTGPWTTRAGGATTFTTKGRRLTLHTKAGERWIVARDFPAMESVARTLRIG